MGWLYIDTPGLVSAQKEPNKPSITPRIKDKCKIFFCTSMLNSDYFIFICNWTKINLYFGCEYIKIYTLTIHLYILLLLHILSSVIIVLPQCFIMAKTLGDRIRYYRKEKGWSQEDLADKLDLSLLAVSNMERNISDISYSRLQQLANTFGIALSELVSIDKEPSEFVKLKNVIKKQEKEIIELQRRLLQKLDKKRR